MELIEYPLEGGGALLVQSADYGAGQSDLGLATPVQESVKRARESLESALGQVTPALKSVADRLRDLSPDELTVEFGLTLTAEAGAIVARGRTDVHFTITLAWSKASASTNSDSGLAGERNGAKPA